MDKQLKEAIIDLVVKMADDDLVMGHRNSEWTGIGPMLEEDLAFSSMAQDKIGHAYNLYGIGHEHLGLNDPDFMGFRRTEKDFKNSHFVELPNAEYDFSLMRHFLFDHAEKLRYNWLAENCKFDPLKNFARKVKGELKYHVMHANTWIRDLAQGTEESKARMQSALNDCMPYALGIFEPSKFDNLLISDGIFCGEEKLGSQWLETITDLIKQSGLTMPEKKEAILGGRYGYHSEHLQPMLDEMTEVVRLDPEAQW